MRSGRVTIPGKKKEVPRRHEFTVRRTDSSSCSELLDAFEEDGDPYLGATFEARLARGVARLELDRFLDCIEDFAAARELAAPESPLFATLSTRSGDRTFPGTTPLELGERQDFRRAR